MTTLTGKNEFKSTLRKLQTTDPKHPDTWNPNYQTLLNNDTFLKQFADEVEEARGGAGKLGLRLQNLEQTQESLSPDFIDNLTATLKYALDQTGVAHKSIADLRALSQQEIEFSLINRGVVQGCTVQRSATAARNLNLLGGVCFAHGRTYTVAARDNAASVPSNISNGSATVSGYLYQSGETWRLAVTAIGQPLPDNAIEIYKITIPAKNTDETDPTLSKVTITSVRRVEEGFPQYLDSPARLNVPIKLLSADDYQISVDVISATGAPCSSDAILIKSRATNGFVVELASAADNVRVRCRVSKLNN